MIGAAILLALVMGRLRITNPWLLGGLIVGMSTAVAELPLSGVPTPVVNLGQVLIGAALGAQFRRDTLQGLGRFLPAVLAATLALIACCLLLAALLQPLTGLGFATLALALAPGGITEMSLTAKLLQLAVPAVTAFQFVRIFVVLLSSAPLYRLLEPLIDPRPPADRT
jgi:membrane AbrB-like protein